MACAIGISILASLPLASKASIELGADLLRSLCFKRGKQLRPQSRRRLRRFGKARCLVAVDGRKRRAIDDVERGCALRRGDAKLWRSFIVARQKKEKLRTGLGGDVSPIGRLAELQEKIVEHVDAFCQRPAPALPGDGARCKPDVHAIVAGDVERVTGGFVVAARGGAIGRDQEACALSDAIGLANAELHRTSLIVAACGEQRQGVGCERLQLVGLAKHLDQLVDPPGALKRRDLHLRLAARAFGARGESTGEQARKRRRG